MCDCHEYHHNNNICAVVIGNGDYAHVCDDCAAEYEDCPHCGALVEVRDNGTCPHCGAVIEDEEEEVEINIEAGKEHEVA